jgi:hypothetical protein
VVLPQLGEAGEGGDVDFGIEVGVEDGVGELEAEAQGVVGRRGVGEVGARVRGAHSAIARVGGEERQVQGAGGGERQGGRGQGVARQGEAQEETLGRLDGLEQGQAWGREEGGLGEGRGGVIG